MGSARLLLVLAAGSVMSRPASAQVTFSNDAIEEIQSIAVRADLIGANDGGRLARLLEDVINQELRRADILFERGDPRSGDCCFPLPVISSSAPRTMRGRSTSDR